MSKILITRRSTASAVRILTSSSFLIYCAVAIADGWHNPILDHKGFKEWTKDVTPILPAKGSKTSNTKGQNKTSPKSGPPQIDSQALAQNKELLERKAWDATTVLAYMVPDNIIDSEFPNFDKAGIPQCREDCKKFLKQLGPIGANVVINKITNILMGTESFDRGIILSPAYEQDMIDVLKSHLAGGRVSANQVKTLLNASRGNKPDQRTAAFARRVQENLDFSQMSFSALAELAGSADGRSLRNTLYGEFKRRLKTVTLAEQVALLRGGGLTPRLKKALLDSLISNIQTMSPPIRILLLTIPDLPSGARSSLLAELKKPAKLKKEHFNELNALLEFIDYSDNEVRSLAKNNAAVLYLQAPIKICIRDAASASPSTRLFLRQIISKKIDRASEQRKTKYKNTAQTLLVNAALSDAQKHETIYVVKQLGCADILVSALEKLNGSLQVQCGDALKQITGQPFGPSRAVSGLKLRATQKTWRKWLEDNPQFKCL
ncbi:MAG: hypothetical protein P8K78_10050 [Pirellulales bacterium]|nr:hypothetical protein [Pirellulales bacterium]